MDFMPFKLLLSEEVSAAIGRMTIEQLGRARRDLSSAQNIQQGVHQARRCLKRSRSLVRLARLILGEKRFHTENRTYRDLGRALARPREASALLEIIERLSLRDDFSAFQPLLTEIKQLILLDKSKRETELEVVALSSLIKTLDASIANWKKKPLPPAQFEDMAHGFALSYERGRKSLKRAIKTKNSFFLHEWRKDVQQCWRQMQVLTLIWPDDIMPRIYLARDISKLLGTEHDLNELLIYMKSKKHHWKSNPKIKSLTKPFRKAVKGVQRDLCLHALERGRRLYAIETEALSKAMTIYWRTGKALQPMPNVVRVLANIETKKTDKLTALKKMRESASFNKTSLKKQEKDTPRRVHRLKPSNKAPD